MSRKEPNNWPQGKTHEQHRSDNQATISIMRIGSSKAHLLRDVTKIYAIYFLGGFPRHVNTNVDY